MLQIKETRQIELVCEGKWNGIINVWLRYSEMHEENYDKFLSGFFKCCLEDFQSLNR